MKVYKVQYKHSNEGSKKRRGQDAFDEHFTSLKKAKERIKKDHKEENMPITGFSTDKHKTLYFPEYEGLSKFDFRSGFYPDYIRVIEVK